MLQRLAIDRGAILLDPERAGDAGPRLFDREHWRAQGALTEQPGGRGSIQFIAGQGRHWALRRYLRGGLAARIAHDRYFYLGEERTRSFRELRLLEELRRRDLPVPAPVAARYRRGPLTYTAELITETLAGARSLGDLLAAGRMDDACWAAVGRCLRRFHDAGVQHADLNANNVLVGADGGVWLLDFDRGRLREPGDWRHRVLDRLARSLAKIGGVRGDWRGGFTLLRAAHDG